MRREVLVVAGVALLAAAGAGLLLPRLRVAPPSRAALPASTDGAKARRGELAPEVTSVAGAEAFQLLVFPVRVAGARFQIVDLAMGRDLAGALEQTGASLVVNGGFFDPDQRPEGLVVSRGETLSAWSASLGGGVVVVADGRASSVAVALPHVAFGGGVVVVADGRAALMQAEGFVMAPGADFAVQARPRLVVDGGANVRHDDGRQAPRTALCVRDAGRELDVIVAGGEGRGPTLARLAELLVARGCDGALNLDGGPSTGVAWRQGGRVHVVEARGPLRHGIAISAD